MMATIHVFFFFFKAQVGLVEQAHDLSSSEADYNIQGLSGLYIEFETGLDNFVKPGLKI